MKLCVFIFIFFKFQNISIAVVGKGEQFHILDDKETGEYVSAIEKRTADRTASGTTESVSGPADDSGAPGDDDPQVAVAMDTQ